MICHAKNHIDPIRTSIFSKAEIVQMMNMRAATLQSLKII